MAAWLAGAVVAAAAVLGTQMLAPTGAEAAMPPIREITFPVEDPGAWYGADWHAPRGGGTRLHLGTDIFAPKLTPLLAARAGVISRGRLDASGISGNYIAITDSEGWEYLYIHINNDSPGTDDGANPPHLRLFPGLGIGSVVQRGQRVAYLGDSGNAEGTNSHVHFEIRQPRRGSPPASINAFPSLRTSQGREIGDQCEWGPSPAATGTNTTEVGYRTAYDDGGIFTHGASSFHGSPGGLPLVRPVATGESSPSGLGYWLVAADGGVFTYGDARFWGSAADLPLVRPIVGMAATPSGRGYWLVAADGGVFTYGDARFWGSAGGLPLVSPIVGMAATPSGRGYWLVAADGGVFTYGDARFWGSLGGRTLDSSIVDIAAGRGGTGYWLLSRAGGIYPFGSASWHGSVQASGLCVDRQGRAMLTGSDGLGYWIMSTDGEVRPFGSARSLGDRRQLPVTPVGSPVAVLGAAPSAEDPQGAALEPLPVPDPAQQAATANDGRPWPPEPPHPTAQPAQPAAEPALAPAGGSAQPVLSSLALAGGPAPAPEPALALEGDDAESIVVPSEG